MSTKPEGYDQKVLDLARTIAENRKAADVEPAGGVTAVPTPVVQVIRAEEDGPRRRRNYKIVRNYREALDAYDQHHETEINLDLETSGLSGFKDKIAVVAMYGPKSKTALVYHNRGHMPEDLRKWLSADRDDRTFIGHNFVGFDSLFLANAGVDVHTPRWFDTLVAEWSILSSGRQDVSAALGPTAKRRLGYPVKKEMPEHTWMQPELNEMQIDYVCGDIVALHRIKAAQIKFARAHDLMRSLTVEQRLMPAVVRMQLNGFPIDLVALERYLRQQETNRDLFEAQLYAKLGKINLNSPMQLKKALAEQDVIIESTNRETLKIVKVYGGEGTVLAQLLLDYRYANQRLKMYGRPAPKQLRKKDPPIIQPSFVEKFVHEGMIHARFKQCGTDTGRFSSQGPNLQQVPNDMRWVFGNLPGHDIVSLDYSQLEIMIAASLSQCPVLLEAIAQEDVHTAIATRVFRVSAEEIMKERRKKSKAASFLLLFGGGKTGLLRFAGLQEMPMTEIEAREICKRFDEAFPGIYEMKQAAIGRVNAGRPVPLTLPTGLRRVLADKHLTTTRLMNTSVQGTAAAGVKFAMIEAHRQGLTEYLGIQVHDELAAAVPHSKSREFADALEKIMVEQMRKVADVPIRVGKQIAATWAGNVDVEIKEMIAPVAGAQYEEAA